MSLSMTIARLGQPFVQASRYLIISRARKAHPCNCGQHAIAAGEYYVRVYTQRGQLSRLHTDHLTEYGSVVLLDKHGQEIAEFGA